MDSRHPESEAPPRIAGINEIDDDLSTIPAPPAPDRDRYWCQECNQPLDPDLKQTTLCLSCQTRNTERPPMSDSEKLDRLYSTVLNMADAMLRTEANVTKLLGEFTRLRAEHNVNHAAGAPALELIHG